MEDTGFSLDEPDWLEQPEQPARASRFIDPVQKVWQLPRLRLSGRRFTGRIDHALVFVTRKGSYKTFLPPKRPTSVRPYVALYEVNTDPQSFHLDVSLPSRVDSFEFEAAADIGWRVADPAQFVSSQERDVPRLLERILLPLMRKAARRHAISESADAEQAVQRAVDESTQVGAAEGLQVTCTVRLRRDVTERTHADRLRAARHEAEAAVPEHDVALMREQHERQLMTAKIRFYEEQLAKGGVAALALHLAQHREDTGLVLERLRADQAEVLQSRLHLIDQVLENKVLEAYQLEEFQQLSVQEMSAILKAEDRPSADSSPAHPALPTQQERPAKEQSEPPV